MTVDMKHILPVLLALVSADSTCGPVAPDTGAGGGSPAIQTECTGPSLRPFTCTVHYYIACNCGGIVGMMLGQNEPVTTTDTICATDSSAAIAADKYKWINAANAQGGSISGLTVLSCSAGQGVQTFPPSPAEENAMCAAWCGAGQPCGAANTACDYDGDCCSKSCNLAANLCN
jgi:hypothetical protein